MKNWRWIKGLQGSPISEMKLKVNESLFLLSPCMRKSWAQIMSDLSWWHGVVWNKGPTTAPFHQSWKARAVHTQQGMLLEMNASHVTSHWSKLCLLPAVQVSKCFPSGAPVEGLFVRLAKSRERKAFALLWLVTQSSGHSAPPSPLLAALRRSKTTCCFAFFTMRLLAIDEASDHVWVSIVKWRQTCRLVRSLFLWWEK